MVKIPLALMMVVSLQALAGTYEKEVENQQQCSAIGDAAMDGAKARDMKIPEKKVFKKLDAAGNEGYNGYFYEGYYGKKSQKDTYMSAWAVCMDIHNGTY